MSYPMIKRALSGTMLNDNPAMEQLDSLVRFHGRCGEKTATMGIGRSELSKGFLACGASGMGKTFLIRECIRQIRENSTEPYSMVVLEVKDDYSGGLMKAGDCVIGQGAYRDESVRWNVYEDITYHAKDDAEEELRCREIAADLFADRKNQAQQFFPDAAQLLLAVVLYQFLKRGERSLAERKKLNNQGLRDFFLSFNKEDYRRLMENQPAFTDQLIGDLNNSQALGVLAEEVLTVINTFSDVFGEQGDFSIRGFVQEKRGRCLFLKLNAAYGETQRRIYGLLVKQILKEVLSRDNTQGDVYLILDEMHFLGKTDLVSAINMGRSKGLKVIAGIQSYSQVMSAYGEDDASSLMAGFGSKAYFRPNDEETRKLIREEYGQNFVEEIVLSAGGCIRNTRQGYVVEDADINALHVGDFICSLGGNPPFQFRIT